MTNWQDVLIAVRDGKKFIPTDDQGIPLVANRAALYELMELMAALTAGYNALVAQTLKGQHRIEALRKIAQAAFPGDKFAPADGWISVDDMLPPKSGEYFTYGSGCGVYPLSYSAKHRLFNAYDHETPEWAAEHAFTEITHWYPRPLPPISDPATPATEEG